MNAIDFEAEFEGFEICPECKNYIDPDVCHCGAAMKDHGYVDGHNGVPMGCICDYADKPKVVKEKEIHDRSENS